MEIDYISSYVSGLNIGFLTTISALLDSDIIFAVILVLVTIIGERRKEKLTKIIIVFALAFILSAASKELFKISRPCIEQHMIQKVPCPRSYAFPSSHAALSFALALAFLNKRSYPAYLLFAVFISFTRIYLSVHSFVDVAGGIVVAAISYYLIDLFVGEPNGKKRNS